MKKMFLFLAFLAVTGVTFGQNLSIYLNDGPRGKIHKVAEEDFYRLAFSVTGLATDVAVKNFIDNCKTYPGVKNAAVKGMDLNGKRSVLIFFNEKNNVDYFKGFLNHLGISKLYFKGKEYSPDNLDILQQEMSKSKNSPQTSKKNSSK